MTEERIKQIENEGITMEELEMDVSVLSNNYYIMMEAAEKMLVELESKGEVLGKGLTKDFKKRHNMIMRQAKVLHTMLEGFDEDYTRHYKKTGKLKLYENMKVAAGNQAYLSLLIADRCGDIDIHEKNFNKIESYIRKFKPRGYITDYTLLRLKEQKGRDYE